MATRGIKAGRAFVELFADNTKLVQGLKRAEYKVKAFGQSVSQMGRATMGLSAAMITPMILAAKTFSKVGDEVAKMAKRTGVSAESLSQLKYVASQTGTEFATLENGLRKMQRSIYDAGRGLSTQTDALRDLNLEYKDLAGLSPEKQFKILATQIGGVEDSTKKAAIAMSLFGRTGTNLIPMFDLGADGINKLMKEADDLGLTISSEAAAGAERFTDVLDRLWKTVKMGTFLVGAGLADALTELAEKTTSLVRETNEWVKVNTDTITKLFKIATTVGKVGIALLALSGVVKLVSLAMAGLAAAVKTVIVMKTVLKALSGPAGWVALAAGIAIATASIVSIDAVLDAHVDKVHAATSAGDDMATTMGNVANATGSAAGEMQAYNAELAKAALLEGKKAHQPFTPLENKADNLGLDEFQQAELNLKKENNWNESTQQYLAFLKEVITAKEAQLGLEQRAQKIAEDVITPQQTYNAKEAELNKLLEKKLVSQQTYDRALQQEKEILAQATADPEEQRRKDDAKAVYDQTRTPKEIYKAEQEKFKKMFDDELIDKNTFKRAIKQAKAKLEDSKTPLDMPANITGEADRKTGQVLGQFSGFARLGVSGDAADRTAAATEETARAIRALLQIEQDKEAEDIV